MKNSIALSKNNQIPTIQFFIFTFLFSWILWLPGVLLTWKIINPSESIVGLIKVLNWIGGIGPSLIAFVLVFKNERKQGVRNLFKRIVQFNLGRWYLPIFLLIPLLLILAHIINMVFFGSPFPVTGLMQKPWWIPIVLFIFFTLQFSEEFGWRGFALDKLQLKFAALTSSIIVGVLWSAWHLPMFLSIGFPHNQYHLPFMQLTLTLIFTSVLITWLQNNTGGSLIPAFLIHAMINFSGEILPLIEKNEEFQGDYSVWIIVNVLLILTTVIIIKLYGYKTLTKK